MATKIRAEHVYKLWGRLPTRKKAIEMIDRGATKDDILEETGHVVGVADVSFEIEEGEIFVVMGLSGSGKSTLLRCVNRLVEPTKGKVFVDDVEITALDKKQLQDLRRKRMSMVFQHFALFPHKTVVQNAGYGLKVRRVPEREWKERALEALELVGLGQWADTYPDNLSGGMQQRVGLARALATDPDILLMDEAFSALDPLIRRQMQNELLQLQERVQKTILFITHDLNEALRVGNRVAVMKDGRVVQIGTPSELVTEPADDYVADFVEDVDHGRVLGVNFVMKESQVLRLERDTIESAIERIRGIDANALYVVDGQRHPVGLVTNRDLVRARREGDGDLSTVLQRNYPHTFGSASLAEIYELCTHGLPVAVLDEEGKLEGVVDPLDVLAQLAVRRREPDRQPPFAGEGRTKEAETQEARA